MSDRPIRLTPRQRFVYGYAILMLLTGGLFSFWSRRKEPETSSGSEIAGSVAPVSEKRRAELKAAMALMLGGTGAALAIKTGALDVNAMKNLFNRNPEMAVALTDAQIRTAVGLTSQYFVFPSDTADPAGAPPGALWYRSDLGQIRWMNGLTSTVQVDGNWSSMTGGPFVTAGSQTGASYATSAAAFTAGNLFVFLLPGSYTDNPVVPIGGYLIGSSPVNTSFVPAFASAGSTITFTANGGGSSLLHAYGYTLDGFSVDGTGSAAGSYGIYGSDTVTLRIGNGVVVKNFVGVGSEAIRIIDTAHYCENFTYYGHCIGNTTAIHFAHGAGSGSFIRALMYGEVGDNSVSSATGFLVDNGVNISESFVYTRFYPYTSGTAISLAGSGTSLTFSPAIDTTGNTATNGVQVLATGSYNHFIVCAPKFDGVFTNVYNLASGAIWGSKVQTISVTGSPFTFTLPQGVSGSIGQGLITVFITGGTVSLVQITRSGSTTTVATATNISVTLRPGDVIVVAYSSAPTMTYVEAQG